MTADNPPAFPVDATYNPDGSVWYHGKDGMSLRDYFAAHCDVAAYGPADAFAIARGHQPTISELAAYIAEIRFIEADAMLSARTPAPATGDE